jgi:hypothetical protein
MGVFQDTTFSPDRFRNEEWRHTRHAQSGRMKLEEFHICDGRPGIIGKSNTVSGGDRGIGIVFEELSGTASSQNKATAGKFLGAARPAIQDAYAGNRTFFQEYFRGQEILQYLNMGRTDTLAQRYLDMFTGGIPARVQDAGNTVRGFHGQGDLTLQGVKRNTVPDEVGNAGGRLRG